MKTSLKYYPLFLRRMLMSLIFVVLVFSCSKNSDNPSKTAVKYCGDIDWSSTLNSGGYFSGTFTDGHYDLVAVSITDDETDDGTDDFHAFHRTNDTRQIINDQPGWIFTYDKTNLVELKIGDLTDARSSFTFETNGYLKHTVITNTDENGDLSLVFAYTYDNNGDPVKITGTGIKITDTGTSSSEYDITATYLTSKPNYLPMVPEIVPFTVIFAPYYILSTHLVDKLNIKMTGIAEDGTGFSSNVTEQYTYTYDSDGKVKTMSHSANNTFTFTYSDCN